MSGEGAVGYAVVAVVGGSVWLAARGVQAAALVASRTVEVAGDALVRVGDRAESERAQWEADHAVLMDWEAAARQVIDVNARLDVLRCAAPADLAARVPASLLPCAESPDELRAWCTTAAQHAALLDAELARRTSAAVLTVLRSSVERSRPITAAEALAHYEHALAGRLAAPAAPATAALDAVARIVGRLSADADAADRADVLAAAAQVASPRQDVDATTLLEELRLRVQRAEDRVRTRRSDAARAATMLQALTGDDPLDPDSSGLRAALGEVVAMHRPLGEDLRGRAERAASRVREHLERDYVRSSVTETLASLGYELDEGFSTVTKDRIRLVRPDWSGHAVQVVVHDEEVKAAVIRLEDRTGSDARREDVEREEQWCGDLEKLEVALADAGVRVVKRRLTPPGDRTPPVLRRRTPRENERATSRERRT